MSSTVYIIFLVVMYVVAFKAGEFHGRTIEIKRYHTRNLKEFEDAIATIKKAGFNPANGCTIQGVSQETSKPL